MTKEEKTKKVTTKKGAMDKKTVEKNSTENGSVQKNTKKKLIFLIWTILVFVSAFALGRVSTKLDFEDAKGKEVAKEKYTVTFDSVGGTAIEVQIIEEGNTVTKPSDPSKEKHIFVEWQLAGERYDFSTKIKQNITLKAIWREIKENQETVTIKFDSNGGSSVSNQTVVKGETVSKPSNPSRYGYKFGEWKLNGKIYDFNTSVTKNITLKASWEEDENIPRYTVTFDSAGGSKVSSQKIIKGNKVSKPSNPTRSGYKFSGWTLNGSAYDFSAKVTKNITLKATWTELSKYTVTFDSNGGSSVSSQTVFGGNKVTKPSNPTRSGYKFSGWTLNGSAYDFSAKVTKNITLKATWTELSKYTVTFDSNGGSSVSSQTVSEGNKVTKPSNPTKSGYKFAGWTLNGKTYDFSSKVTGNITLKATWKQNSYTIKATAVDSQSPARILSVYENGTKISVKSIKYTDGTTLCSGSNMNVNKYALDSTTYKVVLNNGTEVTATLVS